MLRMIVFSLFVHFLVCSTKSHRCIGCIVTYSHTVSLVGVVLVHLGWYMGFVLVYGIRRLSSCMHVLYICDHDKR